MTRRKVHDYILYTNRYDRTGIKNAPCNPSCALKRIKKPGDIFSGILRKGINLEKCLERLDKAV